MRINPKLILTTAAAILGLLQSCNNRNFPATPIPPPQAFTATPFAPTGPTFTSTDTTSPTSTSTAIPTNTDTFTATLTSTATSTSSSTATPSATFTSTFTPTRTFTPTSTSSFTATFTATFTNSFTSTSTPSFTPTNSLTFTPTNSSSFTPSFTPTFTNTATNSFTFTPTSTSTNTVTDTPSFTPTVTSSDSPTATLSATPTITNTPTATFTNTSTNTNSPTVTATPTATMTLSNTPTVTFTATGTVTALTCVNFGDPNIYSISSNGSMNFTYSNAPATPVTLTKFSVYLELAAPCCGSGFYPSSGVIECALYNPDGPPSVLPADPQWPNFPGTKVAGTDTGYVTITYTGSGVGPAQWYDVPLPTPVVITGGQPYWIAMQTGIPQGHTTTIVSSIYDVTYNVSPNAQNPFPNTATSNGYIQHISNSILAVVCE